MLLQGNKVGVMSTELCPYISFFVSPAGSLRAAATKDCCVSRGSAEAPPTQDRMDGAAQAASAASAPPTTSAPTAAGRSAPDAAGNGHGGEDHQRGSTPGRGGKAGLRPDASATSSGRPVDASRQARLRTTAAAGDDDDGAGSNSSDTAGEDAEASDDSPRRRRSARQQQKRVRSAVLGRGLGCACWWSEAVPSLGGVCLCAVLTRPN